MTNALDAQVRTQLRLWLPDRHATAARDRGVGQS